MAGFCGWIPLVYFDKVFSLFLQFVLEHSAKHPEAVVRNRFSESQGLSLRMQIKVFYARNVIGIG